MESQNNSSQAFAPWFPSARQNQAVIFCLPFGMPVNACCNCACCHCKFSQDTPMKDPFHLPPHRARKFQIKCPTNFVIFSQQINTMLVFEINCMGNKQSVLSPFCPQSHSRYMIWHIYDGRIFDVLYANMFVFILRNNVNIILLDSLVQSIFCFCILCYS